MYANIERSQARAIAIDLINKTATYEVDIIDALTVEFDEGWLFIYNSKSFINSGDKLKRLVGNAPVIVSRQGRATVTTTRLSVGRIVAAYRALGPDRFESGEWKAFETQ